MSARQLIMLNNHGLVAVRDRARYALTKTVAINDVRELTSAYAVRGGVLVRLMRPADIG
jgi:hypothetical protein